MAAIQADAARRSAVKASEQSERAKISLGNKIFRLRREAQEAEEEARRLQRRLSGANDKAAAARAGPRTVRCDKLRGQGCSFGPEH